MASGSVMTWRTKALGVTPESIYTPGEMGWTRGSKSKDKKKGKQQYATFKATTPAEFTCNVLISTAAGVDAPAELAEWQSLQDGKGGKLYVGGTAVFDCPFIMEELSVKEARVGINDKLYAAKLELKFKQSAPSGAEKPPGKKKKKKKKKQTQRQVTNATKKPRDQFKDDIDRWNNWLKNRKTPKPFK